MFLSLENVLENWIPEDLTGHPDFPEYLEGITDKKYCTEIRKYWNKRFKKKQQEKKSAEIDSKELNETDGEMDQEQVTLFTQEGPKIKGILTLALT